MNNKDLFNAINNIDEKFITDAGKYLEPVHTARNARTSRVKPFAALRFFSRNKKKSAERQALNDYADSSLNDKSGSAQYEETMEVRAVQRKASPVKIAVSTAAVAAVLVFGVFAAPKLKNIANPSMLADSSVSLPELAFGSDKPKPGHDYPSPDAVSAVNDKTDWRQIEFKGPDNFPITANDVSSATLNTIFYLTENEIEVDCVNFAFIDKAADSSHLESDAQYEGALKRIYKGARIGNLTVKEAECGFVGENINSDAFFLLRNYLLFDGEITANVFIVKEQDNYYCVFRENDLQLPLMSNCWRYTLYGYQTQAVEVGGFSFSTLLPAIKLDPSSVRNIEENLTDGICEATAKLSNIGMQYDGANEIYSLWADVSEITPSAFLVFDMLDVDSLQTVEELHYEIDRLRKDVNHYADVHVYPGIDNFENQTSELFDGELKPGMIIVSYDTSTGGDPNIWTYKSGEVT